MICVFLYFKIIMLGTVKLAEFFKKLKFRGVKFYYSPPPGGSWNIICKFKHTLCFLSPKIRNFHQMVTNFLLQNLLMGKTHSFEMIGGGEL